jgi:hypothetical protein
VAAGGATEGSASFYHQARGLPTGSSLLQEFMAPAADVVATGVLVVTVVRLSSAVCSRGAAPRSGGGRFSSHMTIASTR